MTERDTHLAICTYIRLQYPLVIFTSDLSGQNTSKMQSVLNKKLRSSRGIPDLLIFKPKKDGKYIWHGLFIELKKDGEKLYKKDGSFKTEHIKEQFEMKGKLLNLGYCSNFATGFDKAQKLVDWYMSLEDVV